MKNRTLQQKKCAPCEGGIPKLEQNAIENNLSEVDGWRVENDRLHKTMFFKNFVQAMFFLNQAAIVAETEGHHPDFCVHYNQVDFTLWTHAVGGLTENDFILAAKIDALQA